MKPPYKVLALAIAYLTALQLNITQHKGHHYLNENALFLIKLGTRRQHSWNML